MWAAKSENETFTFYLAHNKGVIVILTQTSKKVATFIRKTSFSEYSSTGKHRVCFQLSYNENVKYILCDEPFTLL